MPSVRPGARPLVSPPKFTPKRAAGMPIINIVDCIDCPAKLGEKCTSPGGGKTMHISRRRRAAKVVLA